MKCRNQRTTKEETGRNQRGRVLCKGKGTRVCMQGFLPLAPMKHPAFPKCSWFWEPSVTAHGTQGSHKTSPRKLGEAGNYCILLKGLNGSSWKSILTHFSPVAPGSLDTRMNRAFGKKPSPEQPGTITGPRFYHFMFGLTLFLPLQGL